MKLIFLLLFALFVCDNASAQSSRYIVVLKDKASTAFSLANPQAFLSKKALARRINQQIKIDSSDLPVPAIYLQQLSAISGVKIINQSRWLSQVCVEVADQPGITEINKLSFVKVTAQIMRPLVMQISTGNKFSEELETQAEFNTNQTLNGHFQYGFASGQIHLHEGEFLHENGFRGEGKTIAILDAGFYHYQTLPAFDSTRAAGNILGTYDFVTNDTEVDNDHPHGMYCFSAMAANIPGRLVGSAPKSSYYLFRTEDAATESPLEEQNWAVAAEAADSVGADVISSSLGYTTFDNPAFDHTYADMDGNTTIAARAADMAAKKGMIVVSSAGNSGSQAWHYIATPADADSIVAVGAVDSLGNVGAFSSYGPSADGQVKPTVASVGVKTALQGTDGNIISGNGTSFAAPNLAGLITCLWEAFPTFSNMEIIDVVKRSSNQYNNPDDRIGYGIPNFRKAFYILQDEYIARNSVRVLGDDGIKLYPNPANDHVSVIIKNISQTPGKIRLINGLGQLFESQEVSFSGSMPAIISFDNLQKLQPGIYYIQYVAGDNNFTKKLLIY